MEQLDIKVSDDTRKAVYDYINREKSQETARDVIKDFSDLRTAAVNFLEALNDIELIEGSIAEKIKAFKNMDSEKEDNYNTQTIDNIKTNVTNTRVLNGIIKFQEEINAFFNRDIILTMVTEDGEIRFYDSKKEAEAYRLGKKNKARLNFTFLESQVPPSATLSELVNNVFNESYQKQHIANVRNIYTTSVQRFDETFNQGKELGHGNAWKYIYWKNDINKRIYGYTNGRGTIGEAYVLAVFEDANKSILKANNEKSIENFYYNYISIADSRAGAIAGDITNKITDSIQFAVKNVKLSKRGRISGASSESFSILVNIARLIIEEEKDLSREDFAKRLEEAEQDPKLRAFTNNQLITHMEGTVSDQLIKAMGIDNIGFASRN